MWVESSRSHGCQLFRIMLAKLAWARSRKSSMETHRTIREVASHRRGASQNSCGRRSKTSINPNQLEQQRPPEEKNMSKIFAKAFLLAICGCMIYATNLAAQTPRSTPLGVGEMAPDFTLVDHHGQKTTLSGSRGKNPVVLVFYRGYW